MFWDVKVAGMIFTSYIHCGQIGFKNSVANTINFYAHTIKRGIFASFTYRQNSMGYKQYSSGYKQNSMGYKENIADNKEYTTGI